MISTTVSAMFCRIILRSVAQAASLLYLQMKAKVYVTLKSSVLDPQGKAIKHSVELLGYRGVSDVRQGKYFEVVLNGGLSEDDARAEAERMAREVLSNPIIEDFRVEIER
jgi:phosphoribosylformylglycinamidine synthase PurS subunit